MSCCYLLGIRRSEKIIAQTGENFAIVTNTLSKLMSSLKLQGNRLLYKTSHVRTHSNRQYQTAIRYVQRN